MNNVNHSRRKWLSLGGIVLGAALLPNTVLATMSTPAPRILRLRNINTGETFSSAYSENAGFSSSTLAQLKNFMRDKRDGSTHNIDPMLYSKLYRVQNNLGLRNTEIQIICGYRSPRSNALMHLHSRGVASHSYHMRGQAVDFRIDAVSLSKVRQAALAMNNGGVGYYPRSNFVHMDTGPVRTWFGS